MMGAIPILSDAIDTLGVAINFIGWIWTNSPAIVKTFIFFTMIVAMVGSLAWFFDQPIAIMGYTVKAPIPHRLFLNDTCREAQLTQTKEISDSGICHKIVTCLNENGGNVSLLGVPFTSWSLWIAPRCSCYCLEIPTIIGQPFLNVSDLICQQTFTDPCYNYTGYTTNPTLNLHDYCVNESLPRPVDILNTSMTLEKCKMQGWDFLDWQSLLILEAIVLLTQFALTMRASRHT